MYSPTRTTTSLAALAAVAAIGCGSKKDLKGPEQDPVPFFQRGAEFLRNGQPDRAAREFERSLSIDPDIPVVRNYLGLAYFGLGEFERAREQYERVLADDPYFTEAHNNMGVVLGVLGETDVALRHFQVVLADPRYEKKEVAQFNIGRLLLDADRPREALIHLEAALGKSPERHDWRFRYSLALNELARHEDAIEELKAVLAARPDFIDAVLELGLTYYKLGEHEAANGYFRRVIRAVPGTDAARRAQFYLRPAADRSGDEIGAGPGRSGAR